MLSEHYELDMKFDKTEMNTNLTTHQTIKLNPFERTLWSLKKNGFLI